MKMAENGSYPAYRGYVFISIAILGWGISTNLIEAGLAHIASLPFLAYRFLIAAVLLGPFVLLFKRGPLISLLKNGWTYVIAFSEASGLVVQYIGQEMGVPPALSALLSLLFLLIVPFLSLLILKEPIHLHHLLAMSLGLVGVFCITTEGEINRLLGGEALGIFLMLCAAFFYAVYIVSTSRLSRYEKTHVDIFALFFVVIAVIAGTSLLLSVVSGTLEPPSLDAMPWIILLVIFSTLIAFLAYFEALKTVSANAASVLLLLQILVPFSVDIVLLDRDYGPWKLLGSGIIVLSMTIVIFAQSYENRRLSGEKQVPDPTG